MRSRCLAAVALILTVVTGCTCGEKKQPQGPTASELLKGLPRAAESRPTALVPKALLEKSRAVVVATADARGTWEAFLQTAAGRALVEGGTLEHLKLSAQMERALSLSHDLASSSEHPLAADRLAEALSGRAALGVVDNERKDADFILVKEVDGTQEFVVRLALMAATLKSHEVQTQPHEGHPVHRLSRGSRTAWVAVFQNVLIASTREDLAQAAVSLALGKRGDSVESVKGFKAQADTLQGHRVAALLALEKTSPTAQLLGLSQLVAGLDVDSGQLELGGELASSAGSPAAFRALTWVPRDAVFFSSLGAAEASLFLSQLREALVLPEALEDSLTHEAFYALLGVQGTRFNHLVGVGIEDAEAASKAFSQLTDSWLDSPGPVELGAGVKAACNSTEGLCLALTKDYLLGATDLESLKASVETGLGKRPAISDVKGFQLVGKGGETRFLSAYVDSSLAADAALAFFEAVGREQSQGFGPGDVQETVAPLCEALKKLPPYGGGLELKGSTVAGRFQPLPVQ